MVEPRCVPGLALALAVLVPVVAAAAAGAAGAQTPLRAIGADRAGQGFGEVVAVLGDLDGDGGDEVLVGLPREGAAGAWSGAVRVYSGARGTPLRQRNGIAAGDRFGSAAAALGDLDADGVPDFAVGAPFADGALGPDSGAVSIYSGRDGALLRLVQGAAAGEGFGHSVAAAGDVDRDQVPDLLVGAIYSDAGAFDGGSCYLVSGATGAALRRWDGAEPVSYFGWRVAGAGDVDGDGVPDLLASAPQPVRGRLGYVDLLSGASGARIRRLSAVGSLKQFGIGLANVGDTDGDGTPDALVGADDSTVATSAGAAYLYSGATGALLHVFPGSFRFEIFGLAVAAAGDVDGDGRADVAIGCDACGRMEVFSGRDGSQLARVADFWRNHFANAVAGADVDGDGVPDVVVGAPWSPTAGPFAGAVYAFSTADLALSSSGHRIDLPAGGAQAMALDAGAAHAGRSYLVLGSLSGIFPGTPLPPVTLPLNADAYLVATATMPNAPPLSNSAGVLDGAGRGAAAFALPPNLPQALGGTTVHHAYLVLGAQGPVLASNPLACMLLR